VRHRAAGAARAPVADALTVIAGVRAGHWTDAAAVTGCTVVLLPEGTVASGEVRGGAPGTREFDLLQPGRLVNRVDAVLLSGGSAFGLAACDGVARWCEERGVGFPTAAGPVPIVAGMVLYDLGVGDPSVRPGAAEGYAACDAAVPLADVAVGRTGAGTGATYGKWRGREHAKPGGIGLAVESDAGVDGLDGLDALEVAALVAVNALGDLRPPYRSVTWNAAESAAFQVKEPFGSTTIGVVVTNAKLDKLGCHLVAQSAHDGLARALEPAHAIGDGDAFVAAATGELDRGDGVPVDLVRMVAARAVERAIVAAVSAVSD
jgi:L-aminopeptidase/D-esterase-like protein